jgi:hypothetical protein
MVSIERISVTEYLVKGLPQNMRENLDDEAYYEGEDENGGRQSERARDQYRAWLTHQGWDTYIDADGVAQSWYPGMGDPDPVRRVTDADRPTLDRAFYISRLESAAKKTPEGKWLAEHGLWNQAFLDSYKRSGSIVVTFPSEVHAALFAEQFNS